MNFKSVAKEVIPPFLLRLYRSCCAQKKPFDPHSTPLFRAYRQLNEGLAGNEIILRPGLKLRINAESKYPFEHFCYLDPEMVEEFDSFLLLANNKKRLLDVGALHGVFSLAFSAQDSSHEALAIEPSPRAAPFLLYNMRANPGLKIEYVEVALGKADAEILMKFDWHHLVALDPAQALSPAEDGVIKVYCKTGDEVCEARSFFPDIIKIDIEGYEYQGLLGLRKTISKARPLICLEVHPALMPHGDSPSRLLSFFNELAYQFYNVKGVPLADDELVQLQKITRVVVIPRESSFG